MGSAAWAWSTASASAASDGTSCRKLHVKAPWTGGSIRMALACLRGTAAPKTKQKRSSETRANGKSAHVEMSNDVIYNKSDSGTSIQMHSKQNRSDLPPPAPPARQLIRGQVALQVHRGKHGASSRLRGPAPRKSLRFAEPRELNARGLRQECVNMCLLDPFVTVRSLEQRV